MPSPRRRSHAQALATLALLLALLPLAAHTASAAPRAQSEDWVQQVVSLTNQERARHGLPALELDAALCASALAHSHDMANLNFFSHTGSNGSTVDERVRGAGYSPLWAYGENIAAGQTSPGEVVDAWMNSEGHRANILSPHYEHIGVAYVYQPGTTYQHYWTQHFASHEQLVVQPGATPTTQLTPIPRTPSPVPVQPTPTPRTPKPTSAPTRIAATPTAAPATPFAPTIALDRTLQVVALLNQQRAAAGLPALTTDPALALAAQSHSIDMARHGTFSHTGTDGSTPQQRVAEAGLGQATALAETIAGGQATAEQVVGAWMAAPNLRQRILDPKQSLAGAGYAYSASSAYQHYWTLNLAGQEPAPHNAISPALAGSLAWLSRHILGLLRWLGLSRVG